MADTTTTATPRAADMLAVKSRVSWGAIAAGAMIALAIYFILTLLGVAIGLEVAVRRSEVDLKPGGAIYTLVALLLAMFFGGWATSRLAVGEDKLEAVLYGIILWGVMFTGLIWLVSAGVSTGFGAVVGLASGKYTNTEGGLDADRLADDLKKHGFDAAQVEKYKGDYQSLRNDPASLTGVKREDVRLATWWALGGVVLSMATVIVGSLTGSGEMLQPVPILGVRRTPREPRS